MTKLVLAIINNDDSAIAASALNAEGFFVTKLSTTGGFLMVGNTTLLIGTEDGRVERIKEILSRTCATRKQLNPSSQNFREGAKIPLPRRRGDRRPARRCSCSAWSSLKSCKAVLISKSELKLCKSFCIADYTKVFPAVLLCFAHSTGSLSRHTALRNPPPFQAADFFLSYAANRPPISPCSARRRR